MYAPFVVWERPCAIRAKAYTIANRANFLMVTLAPYPNLKAYLARVAQRPHVQDALRAEGLLK